MSRLWQFSAALKPFCSWARPKTLCKSAVEQSTARGTRKGFIQITNAIKIRTLNYIQLYFELNPTGCLVSQRFFASQQCYMRQTHFASGCTIIRTGYPNLYHREQPKLTLSFTATWWKAHALSQSSWFKIPRQPLRQTPQTRQVPFKK